MNTKLIVALVIVGVLAVTLIGMVAVSAQLATSTAIPNGTTTNGASTGGFFGWMGRCMGFRGSAYGTGTSAASQQLVNITVTDANTNTTTLSRVWNAILSKPT